MNKLILSDEDLIRVQQAVWDARIKEFNATRKYITDESDDISLWSEYDELCRLWDYVNDMCAKNVVKKMY